MFGHGPFYFSTIRKMVSTFGTCFNELYITRDDSDGDTLQTMKVPLTYGPKDKLLTRVDADPNIERKTAITLPRMSFEMIGLTYDGIRKLNSVGKIARKDDSNANKLKRQYNPVPYNLDFNLYIYVKNQEDGTKIIEQILPFFTPEWTPTVNIIPEMNISMDVPIILNSVGFEDVYEGAFTERRVIIWTLSFTMKTYFYGPVVSKPIIKVSNTQFYVPASFSNAAISNTDVIGRVTVTPGLDANGQPTSNSSISIPYSQIEIDDDFGFIIDIEGQILTQ